MLQGAIVLALGQLAFTCRDLLGWDDRETLDLLNGLSTASTGPAIRLRQLAALLKGRPHLTARLQQLLADPNLSGTELGAEFETALRSFEAEFGSRSMSLELADPTLGEAPALLLQLIHDQVQPSRASETSVKVLADRREAALAKAQALLQGSPTDDQARFERALAIARRAYPL